MGFLDRIALKDDELSGAATTRWINPDIIPMPPSRRTWGYIEYLGFASIASFCITAWAGSASLLTLGLSVKEAMGLSFVGKALICSLAIGNGWIGGRWHVGYTVAQRTTMGMYGAYIGIVIRIILSIVWYGSQAWLGGLCVSAMISSWSLSFLNMKNTFPESAHMVTRDFIGFLLFHLISFPLMLIRPEKSRNYIVVANTVTFFVMLSITAWACSKGGAGPLISQGVVSPLALPKPWAMFYAITSSVGGISSGILNQADYTRFATVQGRQVPGTIIAIFVVGTIVPLFSILTASASMNIWGGDPYWNPLTIIFQWMIDDYSPKARAAAFFCSFGFVCSQLAENILSNGYAVGMDLAGLFPKWINIRRGCAIGALLSWAVQPWMFYNTASVFVATMAAFSVFLAPLTGIMMTDYFLLRKQNIELSHLYSGSKECAYWYTMGVNWRAVVAWIVCFAPALPGMVASLNTSVVISTGANNYYLGNYVFGFLTGSTLYFILMKAFPPPRVGLKDDFDLYGTFTEQVAESMGVMPFGKGEQYETSQVTETKEPAVSEVARAV